MRLRGAAGARWHAGRTAAAYRALALLVLLVHAPAPAFARPHDREGLTRPLPRGAAGWPQYRRQVLEALEEVMGSRPPDAIGVPLEVRIEREVRRDSIIERRILYRSEKSDWVPAILLLPDTSHTARPAVLCLHQSTPFGKEEPAGTAGHPDMHYALELTRRGYVTLVPDFPGVGEHHVNPYALGWASAMRKAVRDNRRAIDVLARLPQVDTTRIACLGHSLGGTMALFTAIFDDRIRAVVTSCGFTSFARYAGGRLSGWGQPGGMPRITSRFGDDPDRVPFDFGDVLAALAPRPVLVIAPTKDGIFDVEGVRATVAAAEPAWERQGAAGGLTARYPDGYHHFTPESRHGAYEWLDAVLGKDESR